MTYLVTHWDLEKEKEGLTELFLKMDKNGDQILGKSELRNGIMESGINISEEEFEQLFAKLDINNNGSISYTEYLAGAMDISLLFNDKYLEDAFNFFDKDGNKMIDKEELKEALSMCSISDVQLSELFSEIDKDHDEKVYLD